MESIRVEHANLPYEQKDISNFKGFDWKNSTKGDAVSFARAAGFKETGMSVNEIALMYDLLEKKKPRVIVELGRNYGTSTRLFMQHIIRHGGSLESWDLKHWPGFIDTMYVNGYKFPGQSLSISGETEEARDKGFAHFMEFKALYQVLYLNDDPTPYNVILRAAHSIKTPVGKDIEEKGVDFLLIDTEHGLQHAVGEYMRWREYLNGEALVAFHDSTLPAVSRSIEIIKEIELDNDKEHGRFAREYILDQQDGFGIQILELR